MQKVNEPTALTPAKPADDAEHLQYLELSGGRLRPGSRHKRRELDIRIRRDVRRGTALRHGARLLQRAYGGEQVAELEWLGQDRYAFGKHLRWAAREYQAPPGRGRVLRPQRFDQLDTSLRA